MNLMHYNWVKSMRIHFLLILSVFSNNVTFIYLVIYLLFEITPENYIFVIHFRIKVIFSLFVKTVTNIFTDMVIIIISVT